MKGQIAKALEDWKPELYRINLALGVTELLAGLAEESSELAQAALKRRRAIDQRNPTPVTVAEATDKLYEELADVLLVAAALGINEYEVERHIRRKAARWISRIEEGCK
mgnify:FL=1